MTLIQWLWNEGHERTRVDVDDFLTENERHFLT